MNNLRHVSYAHVDLLMAFEASEVGSVESSPWLQLVDDGGEYCHWRTYHHEGAWAFDEVDLHPGLPVRRHRDPGRP